MLTLTETRQQLYSMGEEPVGNTPEQMKQQIAAEVTRFTALATKIKLQLA